MTDLRQIEPQAEPLVGPRARSARPPTVATLGVAPQEHEGSDVHPPTGWYARRGKRLLDLAVLAVLLPLAMLPALLVALVNWFQYRSPRKILFLQERTGWGGRVFRVYKFRTMRDAPGGVMEAWSSGCDRQRVTGFGRFLRNTHLDELPQLYNVLRGEMQMIGPRPEMVEIEEWASGHIPGFSKRLVIRPGLTGLAQIVQGYAECDVAAYRRKLEINRLYLRRLSLRLDLQILWRTVLWVLRGKGWNWAHGTELTDVESEKT